MDWKKIENTKCEKCGKVHSSGIGSIVIAKNAIEALPEKLKELGAEKIFLLADENTYSAAGEKTEKVLTEAGIKVSKYIYKGKSPKPDEKAVGSAVMHYDKSCEAVVGVGSGVIGDISKILSHTAKVPFAIVATAPSMDGYASSSSSMTVDGLKVSVKSKCADIIIGDIDFLKTAPDKMLQSGLGDMIAKYTSICEWRISHEINGEYYCEKIAELIRQARDKCMEKADGLLKREDDAVQAVFEGLVLAGIAMNFAQITRPASGVEHYFSHIWDMRENEFHTKAETHGIQCALATLMASTVYAKIKTVNPDKEKAIEHAENFDYGKWSVKLEEFLKKASVPIIALESKEKKYDISKHKKRIEKISEKWDKIVEIINAEVPSPGFIKQIFNTVNMDTDCEKFGIDREILPMTFLASKDIRDKYVLSSLCHDLGIAESLALELKDYTKQI